MKAIIKKNASSFSSNKEYDNRITELRGKEVEIDTSTIFNNQYNTTCGLRIFDKHIERIADDIREPNEDVFFTIHPNGHDEVKKVDFNDTRKNKRFYNCSAYEGSSSYLLMRRNNIRFVLANGEPWIYDNIGYTRLEKTRLTNSEKDLVKLCAKRINEEF